MAERRMLSRKVTNHDNFTSLPAAAQALYMHMVMVADDDGFCDQTNTAMSKAHAKRKDLQSLVERRYLIKFDSGVYAIKHWRMANSIRMDRYTPTEYQEERAQLTVKKNGAYAMPNGQPDDDDLTPEPQPDVSQDGNQTATKRQPPDNQTQPQDSIRLDLGQVNNNIHNTRAREDEKDDGFQAFWTAYPRKSGDIRQAYMEYLHALGTGATAETMIAALAMQTDGATPDDLHFMPNPEKWLRNRGWESKAPLRSAKPSRRRSTITTAAEYKPPVSTETPEELWNKIESI